MKKLLITLLLLISSANLCETAKELPDEQKELANIMSQHKQEIQALLNKHEQEMKDLKETHKKMVADFRKIRTEHKDKVLQNWDGDDEPRGYQGIQGHR